MKTLADDMDERIRLLEAEIEGLPQVRMLMSLRSIKERYLQTVLEIQRLFEEANSLLPLYKNEPLPSDSSTIPLGTSDAVTAERATPKTTLVAMSVAILRDHGRPLDTVALARELKKRGAIIGGTNEKMNLASKLSSTKEIYSIRGQGWWLTNGPLRPTNMTQSYYNGGYDQAASGMERPFQSPTQKK